MAYHRGDLFSQQLAKNVATFIDDDVKRENKKLKTSISQLLQRSKEDLLLCEYCGSVNEQVFDDVLTCAVNDAQECISWCGKEDCIGKDKFSQCSDCGYGMCETHRTECVNCGPEFFYCNTCDRHDCDNRQF